VDDFFQIGFNIIVFLRNRCIMCQKSKYVDRSKGLRNPPVS